MADSATMKYRLLCVEDFATNATTAQIIQTVNGVGDVLMTPLVAASGDSAAASAGVRLGDSYVDTSVTPARLRTRLS